MPRTVFEIQGELRKLSDRAGDVRAEFERLAAKPDLTEGERERFANLEAGIDRLHRDKAALEDEWRGAVAEGLRTGRLVTEAGTMFDDHIAAAAATQGTAHRAIERSEAPDHAKETATRLVESDRTGRAARWAEVTADLDYDRAFMKMLADPERGHLRWTERERAAFDRVEEFRAASLTDSAGGFMVPFALDPSIILTSDGSVNPIRRVARVVPVTTDTWNGVNSAGVTASWLAEGAEVGDNAPTLAQPSVTVHKLAAFVPFSIEVGQDASGFAREMARLLTDAKDQLEAEAFISGSGTGQPWGIVTRLDTIAASEVAPTTAETFAGVVDSQNILRELPPRFRPRASYIASLGALQAIARDLGGGSDANLPAVLTYDPGREAYRLNTKPTYEASFMDDPADIVTTTTGKHNVLVVGDFAHYVVADRVGTTIELVPHLFGTTNNRPTGQRGFFMYARTGADDVSGGAAFRMLQITTTP